MGIISTLKSVLGVAGQSRERGSDPGTAVTVEREPEAASERAVKGIDAPASTTGSEPDAAEDAVEDDGEPVDAIKGIGAAYAERLAEAGIHSVSDLAAADAESLAEQIALGEGRIQGWIDRATARTD